MKINPSFICFSDRKKLEKEFERYCEKNYIPKTNFNLITFLDSKNLLNEFEVKSFINTYECDVNKNIDCNKKNCYINGGPCTRTTDIKKSLDYT